MCWTLTIKVVKCYFVFAILKASHLDDYSSLVWRLNYFSLLSLVLSSNQMVKVVFLKFLQCFRNKLAETFDLLLSAYECKL